MAKRKYTAAQMIEAIHQAGGVIAVAARILGCDRSTVYAYAKEYVTVQQAMDEANEINLDAAEGGLMQFVRGAVTETVDGERNTRRVDDRVRMDALKFYLRTKGRQRGYGDRMEVTGKDGTPIQIERVSRPPKPVQGGNDGS